MIEWLDEFDKTLLLLINGAHHPVFDNIMLLVSDKVTWVPLYLFFMYILARQYGRKVWVVIVTVVVAVIFADLLSVYAFKNLFERLRPCHVEGLKELLHLVHNKCGGKYGFVSSHATNTTVLALSVMMFYRQKWLKILLIVYVSLNCYSRIYLGVHYPFDVLGGILLGMAVALMIKYSVKNFVVQRYLQK